MEAKKKLRVLAMTSVMIATPLLLSGCIRGKSGKSGADGTVWKSGISYTEFTDAKVGDFFIDTDDYILYEKTETSWKVVMENYGRPGVSPEAPVISINTEGYWVINGVPTSNKAIGENGAPGHTPVITVVEGFWHVDGVSTNVKAEGEDGHNPVVTINEEGYWVIDGVPSQTKATPSKIEITNGYWFLDGVTTGVKAVGKDGSKWISGTTTPTTVGVVGDFYLNTTNYDIFEKKDTGWTKIGNIKGTGVESVTPSTAIGTHYMISDGLTEMAANAVELVVDDDTGIAYAVYLASTTSLGESSSLVKMAKFNILQPTNVEWVEVFNISTDFGGSPLSECNIIELNSSTIRVFAVNKSTWTYYYKDVNKKTLTVGAKNEVKFKSSDASDAVSFSKANLNTYISSIGGTAFSEVQSTTKILEVDGYYYTTVVGGQGTQNVLFMKSADGATWTLQSVIHHRANYEAMLEYHDGRFWVMCRNGVTSPTTSTQQNLMYSEDGITWTQSNLALTTSDTRPYLFKFQGELYLAYSSPMPTDYSTVRNWRCNIHIGKIVSEGGVETFDEIVYKESKFGIVYYALHDWYGNMVMLYSSGELNPTEGLMGGWSQGKDCLNYTIIHQQEPELSFKKLDSINIVTKPNTIEYAVGDAFSSTGLTVKAKFSDGTYSTITNYSISTPDMTTAGVKTVTVKYTFNGVEKTATFDITVSEIEKVLESIEVTTKPTKLNYLLNEEFSTDGLVVKASYNVGSPVEITNYSISTPDMTTVGVKTITITYIEGGITKTSSFNIEVTEEIQDYYKLDSVTADGTQNLDTGYKPKANTKVVVTLDKPTDESVEGGKWLFNVGGNKTFGFNIKPNGAYVLDYGATAEAAGNRYSIGTVNWQEGTNTIVIGNGEFTINGESLVTGLNVTTSQGVSSQNLLFFTASNSSSTVYLATNIYEISIYEGDDLVMHLVPAQRPSDNKIGFYDTIGEEFKFSATTSDFTKGPDIVEKTLENIQIVSAPTIRDYALNSTFDPTGLVVKALFEDGTSKVITDYTLSEPDMTSAGTKNITVTYELNGVTKTAGFDITVQDVEKELDSIVVTTNPTKTTYEIDEEFSSAGLIVKANYNVGGSNEITNYTLSTPDMTTSGTKVVTVTYEENGITKTTEFSIIVNAKSYTELTHIETDGTQYINLGYKVKSNTQIVIKMEKPDDDKMGNGWLFQAGNNFGFNIKANGAYVLDIKGTRYNTGTINWNEGINTFVIGNGVFTVNGEILADGLNVTTTPADNNTSNLWFFSASNTDNKVYMQTKIYEISIYEGDNLVMHLIPAQRNSDSKVGLYDTENKKYYFSTPANTDFIAGDAKSE